MQHRAARAREVICATPGVGRDLGGYQGCWLCVPEGGGQGQLWDAVFQRPEPGPAPFSPPRRQAER